MAIDLPFYLSVEQAITIHVLLMRRWHETRFGVDQRDLLESALNRPRHAASLIDAHIFHQAATLCFGLVKNHPWIGGNKRTATYLMEIFLRMNGFSMILGDDSLVEAALAIESDDWDVDAIETWIQANTVKL